jgi:hypothetical protein
MTHSHGKKLRRYSRLGGHLFMVKSRARGDIADQSLCGLTLKEATDGEVKECSTCEQAKDQLWA